jgi:hypothetical protein
VSNSKVNDHIPKTCFLQRVQGNEIKEIKKNLEKPIVFTHFAVHGLSLKWFPDGSLPVPPNLHV